MTVQGLEAESPLLYYSPSTSLPSPSLGVLPSPGPEASLFPNSSPTCIIYALSLCHAQGA